MGQATGGALAPLYEIVRTFQTMLHLRCDSNGTYGGTQGRPTCCIAVHVDDLPGEEESLAWLQYELESRYGELTVQKDKFLHVGYEYMRYPDGSYSSSLKHFTDTLEEAPLPPGSMETLLDSKGQTVLKSLNGCLSYGTGNRPDVAGKVAISQQNSGKDANIRDLKFANRIIKEMRDHDGPHELWYPRFGRSGLKITGVFDASTGRSVEQRYGQLAYVILLGPRHSARDVGYEMCHVLEFSTKTTHSRAREHILRGLLKVFCGVWRRVITMTHSTARFSL